MNIYQSLLTNGLYIISIALQVSGALIVCIKACSIKRKSILRTLNSIRILIKDNNTNELNDVTDVIREKFSQAYTNAFAFAYLAIGYFLAIFSTKNDDNCLIAIGIVLLTLILLLITCVVINLLLTCKKVTKNITKEEYEELGIKESLSTISHSDINQIF